MADAISTCAVCGDQFPFRSGKKYCSHTCRNSRPRAKRSAYTAAAKWITDCAVCGKEFRPKRKENATACSRECGFVWKAAKASAISSGGKVSYTVLRNKCETCGARFERKGMYCSADCTPKWYKPVTAANCRKCGKEFNRTDAGSSRFMCSEACRDAAAFEARRRAKRTPAARADKKLRKALARGAKGGEKVDPTQVFERDGYRCGICGKRTAKGKRGTTHGNAPELDHIIALSMGGSHTYANVQCACRSCNLTKGAGVIGQLHLFPDG
mgnify:CR=1 FL=1